MSEVTRHSYVSTCPHMLLIIDLLFASLQKKKFRLTGHETGKLLDYLPGNRNRYRCDWLQRTCSETNSMNKVSSVMFCRGSSIYCLQTRTVTRSLTTTAHHMPIQAISSLPTDLSQYLSVNLAGINSQLTAYL